MPEKQIWPPMNADKRRWELFVFICVYLVRQAKPD